MKFRTQFNSIIEKAKPFKEGDKVVRTIRDEVDINVLFDKYCGTGCLPVKPNLTYGDTTITPRSLADARAIVNKAQVEYMSLPSNIRNKFANLEEFIEKYNIAVSDDKSIEASMLQHLGLVDKPVETIAVPLPEQPVVAETEATTVTQSQINETSD